MCVSGSAERKTLGNGDQINFDGTYYDYRAANGRQMIKVWVPPAAKTVRGLFISGHGGGTGDSRDFARDENMKALAARFDFGLAGLHVFPGRQVYDQHAKTFLGALDAFAALGHHRELEHVPFVIFGSSNGGSTTYGFINYAPERAICFTSNVSTWFNPAVPTEGALRVPGIMIVGQFDPFTREAQGVQTMTEMILGARARGARWSMIAAEKGHEDGSAFDLYLKLVEQSIALRYPRDADPAKGPVALKEIAEQDGWLADMDSWGSGITGISDYASYTGEKAKAGWLLNEDVACVYRAAATYQNPLGLGVEEVEEVYNPNTDPGGMFSIGGPVVEPGRTLKLVCDVREMADWKKVEFFNGARKLGEVTAPANPVFSVKVPAEDIVWCITVVGHGQSGERRTASPFYFTVRDPSIDLLSNTERAQKPAFRDDIGPVGSKTARKVNKQYQPKADATPAKVLLAYGLTTAQEQSFAATPDRVSPFWSAIDASHDSLEMLPKTHAREGHQFSIVTTADARVKVKAAHSARGLYLYYEVTDNYFMEADEDPNEYHKIDALDALIDSKSSTELNDPSNRLQAINAEWNLYLTTTQYQVAFGRDRAPRVMRHIFADPWDVVFNKVVAIADVERYHGLKIHHAKIDTLRRAQEWFLPWSKFGFKKEPMVGKRIAFSLGYNDTDPGSAAKELRSIDNTNPWSFSASSEAYPKGWGDIEIGPMVGAVEVMQPGSE
jgi:hypothetical protein